MPGRDRSGPMGMGPRTGRGLGLCGERGAAGPLGGLGQGRGIRGGRGGRGGRGRRNMFYATGLPGWARGGAGIAPLAGQQPATEAQQEPAAEPTREQELESLKQQADLAARTLQSIRQRIDELEARSEPSES